MPKVQFEDWGRIPYAEAWEKQQTHFNKALQSKRAQEVCNYLIFCEHPHVYTLGKSGDEQNLLMNHIQLIAKEASFHRVDRGGDITYHGPGQIVGYPILNLELWQIGVKEYIYKLEESIIQTLKKYNLQGQRLKGATGVWLDINTAQVRKICAIGIKVSRHITMHGFAFNCKTDLKYFDYINPCGFKDKGVTSLSKELGREVDIAQLKREVRTCIGQQFEMQWQHE